MIEPLRNLGLQSPRILDLGAHVGEFAHEARGLWSNCHIACVEASDDCLPFLEQVANEIRHAVLHREDDQLVTFWRRKIDAYGGSSGNSIYRETTGFFCDDEIEAGNVWSEQRRTTTLDSLFSRAKPFHLAKLDLQGAELDAILGGRKTLGKCDVIVCEQQFREYNAGAPYAHEVDEAIRRLGVEDEPDAHDTYRQWWESEHEIVSRFQIDRIYVRVGCELDLRLQKKGKQGRPRSYGWPAPGGMSR